MADNDTRVDKFPSFNEAPVPLVKQVIMTIYASGDTLTEEANNINCSDWNSPALPCVPQDFKYSPYLHDTTIAHKADHINSKCYTDYSHDDMDQCNIVFERQG